MADRTSPHLPVLRSLGPSDETVILRYRNTDQLIRTRRSAYYRGLQTHFANWQLAGQAGNLAPPVCLSQMIACSVPGRLS